jgi:tol-pal system protein YbgF
MQTRHLLIAPLSSMLAPLLLLAATPAAAQLNPLTDPLPRTLDERSDKRLDRVEQTLREMRAILYQGRDSGKAVVVQPAETQSQVEALSTRVSDLEETLRRMNGQVDQLGVDVSALRRDNSGTVGALQAANAQNAQLLARLDAIEKQVGALSAAHAAQAEAAANDPAQVFDRAMQLYASGQYGAAATSFQGYVDTFGNERAAPEARYYLGESLFKQADYANAATAYIAAIRGWPQTPWAPDAVIKLSVSLIELRKNPDACGILAEFNTRYPKASPALKAQAGSARTRARCG